MSHASRASRFLLTAGLGLALAASVLAGPARSGGPTAAAAERPAQKAERVVFIVLDQLRPEFIDAFRMRNVKALMRRGTSFPNAYLGHMASETVISHGVMTSGQLPKNMGWSDEWYRDAAGVLGERGQMYVTGSLGQEEFDTLIRNRRYPKLANYLHRLDRGSTVATIGQKNYAVWTMSGPASDIRITFGGRDFDCDNDGDVTWRGPEGVGVPTYIARPRCGRFYVDGDSDLDYGTADTSPAWMYPLAGNRDMPGRDPEHLGGDVWVTDAAFRVMNREDWSGLLLTYGGIDKAGHMWGGLNDRRPYPGGAAFTHMRAAAKLADRQVGRVVRKLRRDGVLDETLVVLTTDHGQQTSRHHFGEDGPDRGNFNWYYGADEDEEYLDPQRQIRRLISGTGGNVEASMQDSAIRTWLERTTTRRKKQAADVMATLHGVRATYYRDGRHYVLRWHAPKRQWTRSEWSWWRRHGQELVDTEAAAYGPDVIGLLRNGASYGVAGDHGGHQEAAQRIPIVFYGAGVGKASPRTPMRSVDILPTILRELGLRPTFRMDGRAHPLG
jgi:hypothetical protein